MKQIIVKAEYFDEVKELIRSINSFFASECKQKNFQTSEREATCELRKIGEWLDKVDPLLIEEPERVDDLLSELKEYAEGKDKTRLFEDEVFQSKLDPIIAMEVLQRIYDNFKEFNKLINGVYDFTLYTKPSLYQNEIRLFGSVGLDDEFHIIRNEDQINPREEEDQRQYFGTVIFSLYGYVRSLFDEDRIQLPENLDVREEERRVAARYEDLKDTEILIDESPVQESVDASQTDTYMSMAKKLNNVRYENGKFQISNELKKNIDFLINQLKKCDTSEDLLELFKTPTNEGFPKISPDDYTPLMPAILLRVFNNTRKYPFDSYDVDSCNDIVNIHKSKMESNKGAKRFGRFDLFSCFKMDKDGTIKFLEDFLKLNFVNNKDKVTISNNTLLTIFNIFDSNFYLHLIYEKIPNADRKGEWDTVYSFIKSIRSKLNKNSRTANVYKDKEPTLHPKSDSDDEELVEEGTFEDFRFACMECLGEMTTTDMQYCDIHEYLIECEINNYSDSAYNIGWGDLKTEAYISESFDVMDNINQSVIMEQETGALPDYMKKRMGLNDDADGNDDNSNANKSGDPFSNPPQNPIDDLADSINTKLGSEGELDDQLGKGFKGNHNKGDGKIVHNITNITIRDSHIGNKTVTRNDSSTTNDLSTGKTTNSTTTNTNSNNKDKSRSETTDKSKHINNDLSTSSTNSNNNISKTKNATNNNNNSKPEESTDISEMDMSFLLNNTKLTMEQVLTILETSNEPPSTGSAGKKPKRDLLTTAMDNDKNTLAAQQGAKRKVQKGVNTARAAIRPISRTKSWLTKIVNSLIKRDEDRVKSEIIENPSYRTALFKANRLALKFGMLGVCYTITPYLGASYLIAQGAEAADKQRMKKEIQEEFTAELKIIEDKIERASRDDTPDSRKAMWKMMRLKSKMERIVVSKKVHRTPFKPI